MGYRFQTTRTGGRATGEGQERAAGRPPLAAEQLRPARVYLEVGLQEWILLAQNRHLHDALTARGYDLERDVCRTRPAKTTHWR
ncbi:hypothetical protein ACWC9T_26635 [Kitasatospora sp. NPDC001159]